MKLTLGLASGIDSSLITTNYSTPNNVLKSNIFFCLVPAAKKTSVLLQDTQLDVLDAFFFLLVIAINLQKQAIARIQLVLVNHLSAETAV